MYTACSIKDNSLQAIMAGAHKRHSLKAERSAVHKLQLAFRREVLIHAAALAKRVDSRELTRTQTEAAPNPTMIVPSQEDHLGRLPTGSPGELLKAASFPRPLPLPLQHVMVGRLLPCASPQLAGGVQSRPPPRGCQQGNLLVTSVPLWLVQLHCRPQHPVGLHKGPKAVAGLCAALLLSNPDFPRALACQDLIQQDLPFLLLSECCF
jgi:hypothetical protein